MDHGIIISLLCTIIGAIPAFCMKNITHKGKDNLLAYSAGIMVAASTYGLIPSALKLSNMIVLTAGMILGVIIFTILEIVLPHVEIDNSSHSFNHAAPILFITAMAIHNIPEGLSIGVSYGDADDGLGPLVSFAIGVQNIPEGFLITLFLLTSNTPKIKAFILTTLTAVVELLASLVGYFFAAHFENIVPYGLAFAAGGMLFVVYKEVIPESHGDGNERTATFAFILGLLSMIGFTEWAR
ncbi:ZIP family metal transporter [Heyndrickxia sp. NPDC080065]|uniref:ZIP family metal transporter n=1 Tax=Heyndrickxia sp. NPDC080065 TaxID=3390568 RepID=UPI003CFCD634